MHLVGLLWAGIAQSLRAGRSGDRIPVGDEIFQTRPDRPCGPPGQPGREVDHPPSPSKAEVEKKE